MKRLIAGLLMVFLLIGAVACAQAAPVPAPEPAPAPAPGPAMPPSTGGDGLVVPTVPAPTPAPAPPPVEMPGDEVTQPWAGERMIVRTGDVALVVTDVATAIEAITGIAGSYDGYVVSSNSWREGNRLAGTISIRVDAGHFDDALRALRQLAIEVIQETTSSTDVTAEYVDLTSRLHNLEASEAQLLELMKQAGKVEEILEVQRELTRTRGEIEQTKGRMQYLEQTSSMSLISVRLQQAALDVNFTANNRRVQKGQDVFFSPQIAGGISPYTYEWDFGDGNTSTDASPTHTYRSEGSFNVSLKVTDDRGNTDSELRNNYIEVIPGWSAGNTASSAWNGLAALGRVLVDFLTWFGIFSPVWIVIGIILYFTWWRRRKKT